jgi:hypothetical protein
VPATSVELRLPDQATANDGRSRLGEDTAEGTRYLRIVPEGLSAFEAGKELQEHAEHVEEERDRRRNEAISIVEAVLLSIVAVLAAWSGYAAAKWSTASSEYFAQASALRSEANIANTDSADALNYDVTAFNDWFTAWVAKDTVSMTIAERRFTPTFRRAFDAWLAEHPATNPHAPPGPEYVAQYSRPLEAKSAKLATQASAEYADGVVAGSNADGYILTTVYLATVLFLAGIGSHFKYRGIRYGLASVGTFILILAVVRLIGAPKPPV